MMRHSGREYGFVVRARSGSSWGSRSTSWIRGLDRFDSTVPHRLWNKGDRPVHGVWFVVGRGS